MQTATRLTCRAAERRSWQRAAGDAIVGDAIERLTGLRNTAAAQYVARAMQLSGRVEMLGVWSEHLRLTATACDGAYAEGARGGPPHANACNECRDNPLHLDSRAEEGRVGVSTGGPQPARKGGAAVH